MSNKKDIVACYMCEKKLERGDFCSEKDWGLFKRHRVCMDCTFEYRFKYLRNIPGGEGESFKDFKGH